MSTLTSDQELVLRNELEATQERIQFITSLLKKIDNALIPISQPQNIEPLTTRQTLKSIWFRVVQR